MPRSSKCQYFGYSVANNQHFAPCRKKTIRCVEKWLTPCIMGTTSASSMQSLGEIELPAGAKMWCICFLSSYFSVSGELFVWGGHNLNKYCVTDYWWISIAFSQFFSEEIALLEALENYHFRRQNGAINFVKLLFKIAKEWAETFVRTTLSR